MKVSLNWLKNYIDIQDVPVKEICDKMVCNHTEQAVAYLDRFENTAYMRELAKYLTARTK